MSVRSMLLVKLTRLNIFKIAPIGEAWKKRGVWKPPLQYQGVDGCAQHARSYCYYFPPDDHWRYIYFHVSYDGESAMIAGTTNTLNFTALVFLYRSGEKSNNLSSENLKDCIANWLYIKLVCCLADKAVDVCTEQSPISIQFCLRLPQSSYDKSTGDITPLTSPNLSEILPSFSIPNRTLLFNGKDTNTKLNDKDAKNENGDDDYYSVVTATTPKDNNNSAITPKMIHLVGSSSLSSLLVSYIGSLDFLDTQSLFDNNFGEDPEILEFQPVNNNSTDCLLRLPLRRSMHVRHFIGHLSKILRWYLRHKREKKASSRDL